MLCAKLLILLDLLDVLFDPLCFLLALLRDDLSQRLGGFQRKGFPVVAVDIRGYRSRLCLKLLEPLRVPLTLCAEADLPDLGIQLRQLLLILIDEADTPLILLDHLVLNGALRDTLKGVRKEVTVGSAFASLRLLYRFIASSSGCFLLEDIFKHIS